MFRDYSKKSSAYYEVRDWLEGFIPQVYGKEELGLKRIKYLLKLLGNPEKKFKSIHVAGTSGKGSTAYYVARLLEQSLNFPRNHLSLRWDSGSTKTQGSTSKNFKIGLHLSPHLTYIGERMQIFKRVKESKSQRVKETEGLIPMTRFINLMSEVRLIVERIKKERPDLTPSYFEILVAASFIYFAKEKVEWAVVEVGLGGRLDATNVLAPAVCVITNVGLDHTEILGKTIEKIAFEKAGIIKHATTVVTGAKGRALKVIEKVAKEKKAPLININTLSSKNPPKLDTKVDRLLYKDMLLHSDIAEDDFRVMPLVAATLALGRDIGRETQNKAFARGFEGRLEEIENSVILDGAHNPDKIKFLIDFVRKFQNSNSKLVRGTTLPLDKSRDKLQAQGRTSNIILVVAFKKGKDWKKMVDLLLENLPIKKVIATKFYATTDMGPTPSQRLRGTSKYAAVDAKEIADYVIKAQGTTFRRLKVAPFAIKVIRNSQEAVFEALRSAQGKPFQSLVLVTGSLYLVGEVRTMWRLYNF